MCRIATISATSRSTETLKRLAESLALLFQSPNWQTFMLVAQEQAPPSSSLPDKDYPGNAVNGGGGGGGGGEKQMIDGFEIPPDVDVPPELTRADDGTNAGTPAAAGGGGGMQVCPHCTFENNPGVQDCEICGLPLSG